MTRLEFKRLLIELLLEDADVGDAVLVAKKRGEAQDMAAFGEHLRVSLPAYHRAQEALKTLQEALEADSLSAKRFRSEDR